MCTTRCELEAEVEYSGSLDVALQAELSLVRGRSLPLSVRLCEVRHMRAHIHAVVTVGYSRAPVTHASATRVRLHTTATPSWSSVLRASSVSAGERGMDYETGRDGMSYDAAVREGGNGGGGGWSTAGPPVLHAHLWLESDPVFDMSLRTTLTRLAIHDFFLIPIVVKFVLLRWIRRHLRRRGGVGGVEVVVPLPPEWLSVDTECMT